MPHASILPHPSQLGLTYSPLREPAKPLGAPARAADVLNVAKPARIGITSFVPDSITFPLAVVWLDFVAERLAVPPTNLDIDLSINPPHQQNLMAWPSR